MNMKGEFAQIIEYLQNGKPVLHHITNYVTARDCADAALAVGASPVMADAAGEVAEFTAASDALVLNLGALNEARMETMELAAETAKKSKIPVVLDPVGVMSSISSAATPPASKPYMITVRRDRYPNQSPMAATSLISPPPIAPFVTTANRKNRRPPPNAAATCSPKGRRKCSV